MPEDSSYWIDLQRYESRRVSERGVVFHISAVITPNARKVIYSRLRLIIVDESPQVNYAPQVYVSNYPGTERYRVGASPSSKSSLGLQYREVLQRRASSSVRRNQSCFTLPLGFHRVHASDNWRATQLRILSPVSLAESQSNLRIIYDGVHELDSSGRLLPIYFECVERPFPRRLPAMRLLVPIFSILATPITQSSRNSGAVMLPPSIICSIAKEAFKCHSYGYRQQIFQIGTVCRAWTPVLDLYFSIHARFDECQQSIDRTDVSEASIGSVVRSLELRPERARLMRDFSLRFYRECRQWAGMVYPEKCDVLKTANRLLGLLSTSRIEHLDLHSVPRSLYPDYISALLNLRGVLRCSDSIVSKVQYFDQIEGLHDLSGVVAFEDLPKLLKNWPDLSQISLSFGRVHECVLPRIGSLEEASNGHAFSNLNELTLSTIAGTHQHQIPSALFVHFFQATIPLRVLSLSQISNLRNQDLRFALLQTYNTLVHLHIHQCTIERSDPHEVNAIDETITYLDRLMSLTITYTDCITAETIIRKKRHPDEGVRTTLIATSVDSFDIDREDLNRSQWDKVSLKMHSGTCLEVDHEIFEDEALDMRWLSTV